MRGKIIRQRVNNRVSLLITYDMALTLNGSNPERCKRRVVVFSRLIRPAENTICEDLRGGVGLFY